MPLEWLISRVAEEFGCTPSVAERELFDRTPLVLDIMLQRSYVRMKDALARAKRPQDEPEDSPLKTLVWEIQADLLKERHS